MYYAFDYANKISTSKKIISKTIEQHKNFSQNRDSLVTQINLLNKELNKATFKFNPIKGTFIKSLKNKNFPLATSLLSENCIFIRNSLIELLNNKFDNYLMYFYII